MTPRHALAPAAGTVLGAYSWAHPQHLTFQRRVVRSKKRPSHTFLRDAPRAPRTAYVGDLSPCAPSQIKSLHDKLALLQCGAGCEVGGGRWGVWQTR